MPPKSNGTIAVLLVPVMFIAGLFSFLLLLGNSTSAAAACGGTTAAGSVDLDAAAAHAPVAGYAGDQLKNAAAIMNAAETLGLTQQGQIIGVMTAMGESGLRELPHGDLAGPDSRGLFQQRDNGMWGSLADRLDPTTSASNFFTALLKVPGWESLDPTAAAHKVQGNADPFYCTPFFTPSQDVVSGLTGGAIPAGTTPPSRSTASAGCGTGSIALPLAGGFDMTSHFGPRIQPVEGASSWHPANDLQTRISGTSSGATGYSCGSPIYAVQPGTVTVAANYTVSIKEPAGYTISYLHMYPQDVTVKPGDTITQGQEIGITGRNGPATGCHLDIRINSDGSADPAVTALPQSQTLGAPYRGFVDPEKFFALFGVSLCDTSCKRNY